MPASDEAALRAWGLDNSSSLPQLLIGPRGFRLPASLDAPPATPRKGKGASKATPTPPPTSYVPPPDSFKGWKAFPSSPTNPMNYASLRKWLEKSLPPPSITQLSSQGDFDRAAKASGLLFIALLPASPEARDPSKKMLERVTGGWEWTIPDYDSLQSQMGTFSASRPYMSWAWMDGEAQSDFVGAFSGASIPGLIAYNARKGVYSVLKGSLTEGNVKDFVNALVVPPHPRVKAMGLLPPDIPREKIEKVPALVDQKKRDL